MITVGTLDAFDFDRQNPLEFKTARMPMVGDQRSIYEDGRRISGPLTRVEVHSRGWRIWIMGGICEYGPFIVRS